MAAITKKHNRLKLQFIAYTDHSIHAGLVAVEAMARHFDLWNKVRKLSCLDPRTDKKRVPGPEVIVGQLIYALCSGGGCLSDSEALDGKPLPHGSITFVPTDQPSAAPVTAYIMNSNTVTADYRLDRSVGPVPGKYRVEICQDAVKWVSNGRDPYLARRNNLTAELREEWYKYLRAPGWGAPTIEDGRLFKKARLGDASDLIVELKPGENQLNIEVFSK